MKKFPFVKQVGNTDCGPAYLSMILSYYNINNAPNKEAVSAALEDLAAK